MNTYMETPRLILRDWKEEDIPVFAGLNNNDQVMEFFLKKLSYQETLDFYNRIRKEFASRGYGLYAVEKKENCDVRVDFVVASDLVSQKQAKLIGCNARRPEKDDAPAYNYAQGYATEAASACLEYAKKTLGLKELYSFTSLPNKRSERVMQKTGMVKSKEFDHPLVSPDHPLCRHVLYKISLINR